VPDSDLTPTEFLENAVLGLQLGQRIDENDPYNYDYFWDTGNSGFVATVVEGRPIGTGRCAYG